MSAERRRARKAARRAMKARRAAVKAKLAEARAAARRRAPVDRAARRRSLRRRLLLLAILLLLLLLRRCDCECEAPPEGGPAVDATVDLALGAADAGPDARPAPPPARRRAPKKPIEARIRGSERPAFENPTPAPADWLAALRIQVSARGPRLARCFEGTDRPGALAWGAVVDIDRGVVSDHSFEPVLGGADLSKELRACLTGVLADPPYRLPPAEGAGSPRISIVVEF